MRRILTLVAVLLLVVVLGVTAVLARGPEKAVAAPPVSVAPAQAVPQAQANVPAPAVLVQDPVEPTTPQDAPAWTPGQGMGMMHGRMHGSGGPMWGDGTALDIVAGKLGLTADELSAALQDGATVADLAARARVTVEEIVAALTDAHGEALQAAVDAGTITAEDAALMQERMAAMWAERLESGRFFGGQGRGSDQSPACPMNGDGTLMPHRGMGRGGMRGNGLGQGSGVSG
jgi:hypothetical protein